MLAGEPDERADVYGLGVVCREALGGDVPDELAPVLDAAVATNPDDRPASASELARLLRAAVPSDAVRLPRPGVTTGRTFDTPTRMFGPRPPVPSVRRARGRNRCRRPRWPWFRWLPRLCC